MRNRTNRKWLATSLTSLVLILFTVGVFTTVTLIDTKSAVAADGDSDKQDDNDKQSVLSWAFEALGWKYMIVFSLLSFVLVALIVMNLLMSMRDKVAPVMFLTSFEEHFNQKQYQEAYDLAKNDDSVLGKVLSAGLEKLSTSYPQAIEAMQEVGEEESMTMEHRLSYLALIGTISPMVGLFGTVDGMIEAFKKISDSTTTPPANELAEGISTALVTTLVGLFLAIPAITIYNILRNRIAKLLLEVGIMSEGLMNRFQNVGGKKPS